MSVSQAVIRVTGRPSLLGGFARAAMFTAAVALVLGAGAPLRAQVKELNEFVGSDGKTVELSLFKTDHPRKMTQLQGTILPVINTGKPSGPADLATLEKLAWLHIAELTWPSSDPSQSPEQRRMVTKTRWLTRQLGATDNNQVPDAHDKVNSVLLKGLPTVISDTQYSLPARYNALLLLGSLDKNEPDALKNKPAVPLAEALPLLLKAFQAADLGETLRIGALFGIERHCGLQTASADRALLAAEFIKLLNEQAPPAGWSPEGFHWSRKLVLQSVAALGLTGASEVNRADFVTAIHRIIADDKQPLFLRREACAALGALNPGTLASGPVKPNDFVKALANFTLNVTRAGSPRIDATAPLDLSKAEDVLPAPVEGPGFNMPGVRQLDQSPPPKKLFADAVSYYLHTISQALGGRDSTHGVLRIAGIDDASKTAAEALIKDHINPMLAPLGKPVSQLKALQLAADMQAAKGKLETWMQGRAMIAAPAPAGPGPAAAGQGGAVQPGVGGGVLPVAPAAGGSQAGIGGGALGAPLQPR